MRQAGYVPVLEATGATFVDFNRDDIVTLHLDKPLGMPEYWIARTASEASVLISLAVLKVHDEANVSLACKNLVGITARKNQSIKNSWAISMTFPAYVGLYETGELHRRVERAVSLLGKCVICPRACRVNRLADERGECRVGRRVMVASYGPRFGEERPLVGRFGSGTIFFSYCSLRCLFCQNYTINQMGEGDEVSPTQRASTMLHLQRHGCHNVNLVTPTHVVPQTLEALETAIPQGLHLPLVYNTGGYDSLATLRLLDGVIDIYMPDMKYSDARIAEDLSGIKDYPKVNQIAVKAMRAQVGDLVTDEAGIAKRGLIIRHLVLPHGLAGTESILRFIAEEISRNAYVNIMDQYRPCYRAYSHPLLNQPITREEFLEALHLAKSIGLTRLDERRPRALL